MNKTLRTFIIVVTILIGAIALVGTGFVFGRSTWGLAGSYPGWMMGNYNGNEQSAQNIFGMGSNMMGSRSGPRMMNGTSGYNMMGPGMMMNGNSGYGMMGSSMMGGSNGWLTSVDPLSIEDSREAVENYLVSFGNDDLVVEEIMVFDNNAYAIVIEESTGVGAFELLIDPVTKAVFPEYGPNMMWNLKYGMMSGFGGYGMMGPGMMMGNSGYSRGDMGGMMGGFDTTDTIESGDVSAEMPVGNVEAQQVAQQYLDTYYPGVTISDEITAFYGYYTIDLEREGEIVGMLSVNGFTQQVFPHTWHGEFVEMVHEPEHE